MKSKSVFLEEDKSSNTYSVESLNLVIDQAMMFRLYGGAQHEEFDAAKVEKKGEKEKASEKKEAEHPKPTETTSGRRTSQRRKEKEEKQREEERLEKQREEKKELKAKEKADAVAEENEKIVTCYERIPQITPNSFKFSCFKLLFHSFNKKPQSIVSEYDVFLPNSSIIFNLSNEPWFIFFHFS